MRRMSALPPKADIAGQQLDVRFVPVRDVMILGTFQRDQHIEVTRTLLPKSNKWLVLR
jgi:hypothetical protein